MKRARPLKNARASSAKNATRVGRKTGRAPNEEPPLSRAWIKELERRLRDSRDPVRYMLVTEFSRKFILYYNVTDDTFAMNDPSLGTLFKRHEAAEKVKTLLGRRIALVKFAIRGGRLKRLSPFRGWLKSSRRTRRRRSRQ